MIQSNEDRIVKSLETIAECLVKSNEMAKEALKKSNQLYEANMVMKKEEIGYIPYKVEITTPIDDAVLSNLMKDLDGT